MVLVLPSKDQTIWIPHMCVHMYAHVQLTLACACLVGMPSRRGSGSHMIQEEQHHGLDYHSSSDDDATTDDDDSSSASASTDSSDSKDSSSNASFVSMREVFGYTIPTCILTKDYMAFWRTLRASSAEMTTRICLCVCVCKQHP